MKRVLISAVAAVVAVLLFEGAWSLWVGEPLLRRLIVGDVRRATRLEMTDEERMHAAALTTGPYALATDPEVGLRMKSGLVEREIMGGLATTDAHGMRVRPGPPPDPGATRIVILGDSVAFGFGVDDDETWAAQLESWLARTMAPDAPRPEVLTVACPGWNTRNECRYLQDHLARIDPDVVVLLPISNDLYDSAVVNEAGHRTLLFDAAHGGSTVHVNNEEHCLLVQALVKPGSGLSGLVAASAVPHAILSDVTPESRRRWEQMVRDVAGLRRRLESRGCRFAVACLSPDDWSLFCEYRLLVQIPDLAVVPLLEDFRIEDQLPADPHPNATCIRAATNLLAEFLIEREWVPGAGATQLAPLDAAFDPRRRRLPTLAERQESIDEKREIWSHFIGPVIDLSVPEGVHQIYGGVHFEGRNVGRGLFAVLRNDDSVVLELSIERLSASTGLYPLELAVTINGDAAGSFEVEPPDDAAEPRFTLALDVPDAVRGAPYLEIEIRNDNWIEERVRAIARTAAYRFERLALRRR